MVLQVANTSPTYDCTLWNIGPCGSSKYPAGTNNPTVRSWRIWDDFGVGSMTLPGSDDMSGHSELGRPSQSLDQPHIFNVYTKTNDWAARINGVLLKGRAINRVSFTNSNVYLCANGSGSRCFDGLIAEVLMYSRVLTADERFALGIYLNWRYNLTANVPATPSDLRAFAVSSNQISVGWSSPLSNIVTRIIVQRSTSGGSFTNVSVLENANSYLDTDLVPGAEYIYRVMAANYAGVSGCSTETNVATFTCTNSIPLDALKVWYKADSGYGGNPISCWADQSANGNHAFTPYGGGMTPSQPGMIMTNGRPAFYFDHTKGGSSTFVMGNNCRRHRKGSDD